MGNMRLDDVWLQTTLNTPNILGVWQIKKWSLVSLKAHQPRQGQSPLAGCCFFYQEQVIENVKEIIVWRLGKFQKKYKTETSCDITTTTYKKNTLKTLQQMKLLFTEKHSTYELVFKFTKHRKQ